MTDTNSTNTTDNSDNRPTLDNSQSADNQAAPTNQAAPQNQPVDTQTVDTPPKSAKTNDIEGIKRPRFVNTFMKRRTHLNKNAEQALVDPYFAKYIVNQQPLDLHRESLVSSEAPLNNEGTSPSSPMGDIDNITSLRALFSDITETPNGPDAPLTFEIGFGMGTSLVEMAAADPTRNFVGVEVHEPGIGKCAYMADEHNLTNLKIINGDALKLLQQLPENHIDRIQLYFPDPWQKKRHYKRRFVSPERMQIVTRSLKPKGWFHTATDWEHYAFWMLEVLDNFDGLTNAAGKGNFTPRPVFRPMTKFENRGIDRGHGVWDLIYIKD